MLASAEDTATFALEFLFDQYYLAEPQAIRLLALISLQKTATSISICAAILVSDPPLIAAVERLTGSISELQLVARQHRVPWLELSSPLILDPVKIAKPWGQEIWYSGMEARGQSNVIAQGFLTPLPWLLALMPAYLTANKPKNIILLKTLDPLPDEVYGDLYFELHEQKQEVYVVTHIDPEAWPEQTGEMRLGFDREKIAQFANDDAFKAAYLAAVSDYEKIRRKIDDLLDTERASRGLGLNIALDVVSLSALMQLVPEELQLQERQARAEMNSFSAVLPLQLGDVIKIPCYVPHALQHGVRTIEWQTPVYERKILSFAQKVLTQSHWDTQAAMANVEFTAPPQLLGILSRDKDVLIEEIVKFADFRVLRINLGAGQEHLLQPQNSYGLLMPIGGDCTIVSEGAIQEITAETAVFIPQQLFSNAKKMLRLRAGCAAVQLVIADVIV